MFWIVFLLKYGKTIECFKIKQTLKWWVGVSCDLSNFNYNFCGVLKVTVHNFIEWFNLKCKKRDITKFMQEVYSNYNLCVSFPGE